MADQPHRDVHGVLWATVFLTILIAWGLTIVVFSNSRGLTPVGVALIVGLIPGLVTVPLLLTGPAEAPTALATGRVLVWLQALVLLVACILGVVVAVT